MSQLLAALKTELLANAPSLSTQSLLSNLGQVKTTADGEAKVATSSVGTVPLPPPEPNIVLECPNILEVPVIIEKNNAYPNIPMMTQTMTMTMTLTEAVTETETERKRQRKRKTRAKPKTKKRYECEDSQGDLSPPRKVQ